MEPLAGVFVGRKMVQFPHVKSSTSADVRSAMRLFGFASGLWECLVVVAARVQVSVPVKGH